MKRWNGMLTAATLALALCGALLSFTLDSGAGVRATLAQILVFAALGGFIATAALRSRAGGAEAVGAAPASAAAGAESAGSKV